MASLHMPHLLLAETDKLTSQMPTEPKYVDNFAVCSCNCKSSARASLILSSSPLAFLVSTSTSANSTCSESSGQEELEDGLEDLWSDVDVSDSEQDLTGDSEELDEDDEDEELCNETFRWRLARLAKSSLQRRLFCGSFLRALRPKGKPAGFFRFFLLSGRL